MMMLQTFQSLVYLAFICAIHMRVQSLFRHAKMFTHSTNISQNSLHTYKLNPVLFNKMYTIEMLLYRNVLLLMGWKG